MAVSYRQPHRFRKKRHILKNRFFWLTFLSLIILGGIFYFSLFSDFFQVKRINVTGSQKVSSSDIKSVAVAGLEQKLLLFKTKSIFLININKIKTDLSAKFPLLDEVTITRGLPDVLNIKVKERKEIGIFCRDIDCFLMDGQGVIFENTATDTPLLKFANQTFSQELNLGKQVFERGILNSILKIESTLRENFGIPVKEVSMVAEDRLNLKTSEDWEIYFNLKGDLQWQTTELAALLENKLPMEKRKNLKYVDLRFDKIYVFPEIPAQ
jgi:cell division septal protein FtsQ